MIIICLNSMLSKAGVTGVANVPSKTMGLAQFRLNFTAGHLTVLFILPIMYISWSCFFLQL